MSRKVNINLPEIEKKTIEFCDKNITVQRVITLEQIEAIIGDIRENILYNPNVEDKYFLSIVRYIKDVLELCTNINTKDFKPEDFNNPVFEDLLCEIDNYYIVEDAIVKEYDKWVMENCFGILSNSMPSVKDMEESMNKISQTIEDLPEDKLELISKSIVWNNMPTLGQQIAPAEHIDITEGE